MAEVIVAPGAESLVVSWLSESLADRGNDAWVSTSIPDRRPAQMVRVRRRGGPMTSLVIDNPLMLIECWAADEVAAEDLAGLVAGLFTAMDGEIVAGQMIYSAEIVGGPTNDPDPDTKLPRYTLTGQLRTRASAI